MKGEEHQRIVFESLQRLGTEAIKITLLINGGAAVALLAFFAALKGADPSISIVPYIWGMRLFALGVALSGFAAALSYITNLVLYNETLSPADESRQGRHQLPLQIAMVFVIFSVLLFAIGAWQVSSAVWDTSV